MNSVRTFSRIPSKLFKIFLQRFLHGLPQNFLQEFSREWVSYAKFVSRHFFKSSYRDSFVNSKKFFKEFLKGFIQKITEKLIQELL